VWCRPVAPVRPVGFTLTLSVCCAQSWSNISAMASSLAMCRPVLDAFSTGESEWKRWFSDAEPEKLTPPNCGKVLEDAADVAPILNVLCVRALRPDRFLHAASLCVQTMQFIQVPEKHGMPAPKIKVPLFGPSYGDTAHDVWSLPALVATTTSDHPVLFLLATGSDPTDGLLTLARKARIPVDCVSMGAGQEGFAEKSLVSCLSTGSWLLLQNCHLCPDFIATLPDVLATFPSKHSEFRLFLTSESSPTFPVVALHAFTKVSCTCLVSGWRRSCFDVALSVAGRLGACWGNSCRFNRNVQRFD
jgi:dynein heavy chain, axonemal